LKDFELVDGHLVERHMKLLSSWVGGQLHFELTGFLREHPLGWAWPADQGYVCFTDSPGNVLKPNVSFVLKHRLPEGPTSEDYIYIAPDLAGEVVLPNDLAYEVQSKVIEYLAAGVPLVWAIDPEARTVQVFRRDGSISWLREDGELSGEDVLPAIRRRLTTIFPERAASKTQAGRG
jgi:Uma2 family endonuclease